MSDEKFTHDPPLPPEVTKEVLTQSLVETRREAAEEMAGRVLRLLRPGDQKLPPTDEEAIQALSTHFEEVLIQGEKRGLSEGKKFLMNYVTQKRQTYAAGVANHVQQALQAFHDWTQRSAEFVTKAQFEELKASGKVQVVPNRKFFGGQSN